VFNRGKVRRLEAELETMQEENDQLRSEQQELAARVDLISEVVRDLSQITSVDDTRAQEILASKVPDLLPVDRLPFVSISITVVDSKYVGISDSLGQFSQTLASSLAEVLMNPSIVSITQGEEIYQALDYDKMLYFRDMLHKRYKNYKRTIQIIRIESAYVVSLEVVNGSMLNFMKQVFKDYFAEISLKNMEKNDQSSLVYRIFVK